MGIKWVKRITILKPCNSNQKFSCGLFVNSTLFGLVHGLEFKLVMAVRTLNSEYFTTLKHIFLSLLIICRHIITFFYLYHLGLLSTLQTPLSRKYFIFPLYYFIHWDIVIAFQAHYKMFTK